MLREIGVETGGSNVQFAVDPETGRMVVIEMNPRVSRSSALASKATGFPIAKVAARLAVGYTLDELDNDITGGVTPASFEPTIDYVVTKIPRFAFEKFPGAEPLLTTSMKSVGEAMAIGRTFQESVQKALRSLETGLTGFNEVEIEGLGQGDDKNAIRAALALPSPDRLLKVAQALRLGSSTGRDPRDLQDRPLVHPPDRGSSSTTEARVRDHGLPADTFNMRGLKAMGFSDARLGELAGLDESEVAAHRYVQEAGRAPGVQAHRYLRRGIRDADGLYVLDLRDRPRRRRRQRDPARPTRGKIVILGGGPNRIGQGIEFDYCCCHAAFALSDAGL